MYVFTRKHLHHRPLTQEKVEDRQVHEIEEEPAALVGRHFAHLVAMLVVQLPVRFFALVVRPPVKWKEFVQKIGIPDSFDVLSNSLAFPV